MSEIQNPIAGALSSLGQSISQMTAAEAARRRDALEMQNQQGQQQLALESLKLQGQRQEGELGLQGAKQGADIRMGEANLGLRTREVTNQETQTQQQGAVQAQNIAASKGQEARAPTLLPEQVANLRQQRSTLQAQQDTAEEQEENAKVERQRLQ